MLKRIFIIILIVGMFPSFLSLISYLDSKYFSNKVTELIFLTSFSEENCGNLEFIESKDRLKIKDFDITDGVAKCINKKLEGKKELVISRSSGGRGVEAIHIGNYVKKNNIAVKIEKTCLSACLNILAASPQGNVCYSAMVGTHSVGFNSNNVLLQGYLKPLMYSFNEYQKHYFESLGVNMEHFNKILKTTPFKDFYYMNAVEAKHHKYIDNILNCSNFEEDVFNKVIEKQLKVLSKN